MWFCENICACYFVISHDESMLTCDYWGNFDENKSINGRWGRLKLLEQG